MCEKIFNLLITLQFLALLSDIAVVTLESEPRTLGYSWFKSTGEDPNFPNHHVRGFEIYEDEAASVDVHRLSEPYKKMRSIVGPQKVLARATDLSYAQPTGIGFLTRPEGSVVFQGRSRDVDDREVLEVLDINPGVGLKHETLEEIKLLADHIEKMEPGVLSFWALEFLPEYNKDGIILVARFENRASYTKYSASPEREKMM